MVELPAKLSNFFAAQQTRTLASLAPLGVVAGAAGLIVGAAVATPAFAAAGLGLVLTSVAANIASSLVYDLVKPDLDASERERKIAQGLQNRDPGVIRLVAEALAGAGPEVARAIPDATRAELIDALAQGMQVSGGALAVIAPRYTQALRDARTDWAALQAELRGTISRISQTMEASELGVISGGHMQAPHAGGPVEQVMRATKGGRIESSSQIVTGGAGDGSLPGETGTGVVASVMGAHEHLQRLLASHTRRLQQLESRAATEGIATPPQVTTEIEDIRAEIARLKQQIGE